MIFSKEAKIDIPQWQVVASKKSGRQFFLTSSENSCIFGMYFVPAMACEVSIIWPWYTELNDTIIHGIIQNKSNGVRTINAISLEFVPFYRTSTCSFELLLLKSSSDIHTFQFQTIIYRSFGQKRRFCAISTRVWRTDGRTDRRTDRRMDGRTDGWTHPLIEMQDRI